MKSVFVFLILFGHSSVFAQINLQNMESLRASLGLEKFEAPASIENLKIAILDNGFQGFKPKSGQLPDSAEYIAGNFNEPQATDHGLRLAQVIWSLLGKPIKGPKFFLLNANGFSNLKSAIQTSINRKVDINLYAQVWEYGGNFDGKGFINKEVSRATDAGIIWVNAAGNFRDLIASGKVEELVDAKNQKLWFENKIEENFIKITLAWNDFQDGEDYRTQKDLDLFIYDSKGALVASSELRQTGTKPLATDAKEKPSAHAREIVSQEFPKGRFYVVIKNISENFSKNDKCVLSFAADPGSVSLDSPSKSGEILVPADNPNVITVGERVGASSRGPTTDGRLKPEIQIADAGIELSNGKKFSGSTAASNIFAAVVAAWKSKNPSLTTREIREKFSDLSKAQGCLTLADKSRLPEFVASQVPEGGKIAVDPKNGRSLVLTEMDPIQLAAFKASNVTRDKNDELLFLSANFWEVVPVERENEFNDPFLVEFVQEKFAPPICGEGPIWKSNFDLASAKKEKREIRRGFVNTGAMESYPLLHPKDSDLQTIAKDGDVSAAEFVNKNLKADLDQVDSSGRTPLITAIMFKNKKVAEYLLKSGAKPNLKDNGSHSALDYALFHRDPELIDLLLKYKADPNLKDLEQMTALRRAVQIRFKLPEEKLKVIQSLLKNGGSVDDIDSETGNDIVQTAIIFGCSKAEVTALAKSASDLSRKNSNGDSAISMAKSLLELELSAH